MGVKIALCYKLLKMILYSSGGLHLFNKSASKGHKYLSSFFWDKNPEKLQTTFDVTGQKIFLDSGGFTGRFKNKPIDVYEYCDYVVNNQHLFSVCVNLDVGTHEEQKFNQKVLDAKIKIPVLPVFHSEEYFDKKKRDWFEDEIKNRDDVSVGGIVGEPGQNFGKYLQEQGYFDWLFYRALKYNTRVHGLGVTAVDSLMKYPFYSVDSSTWLAGARYGTLLYWNPVTMKLKTSSTKKIMKDNVVKNISEIKLMEKDNVAVLKNNLKAMYQMEKFITSLWAQRGIKWD